MGGFKKTDDVSKPAFGIMQPNRDPFANKSGEGGFQLSWHMRTIIAEAKSRAAASVGISITAQTSLHLLEAARDLCDR